jgi:hypothetical protein
MKTIGITIALAAIFCGACAAEPSPQFPRTFLDESHDEWLETNCQAKGVVDTTGEEFNTSMLASGANFAEVVGYTKGVSSAKSAFTLKVFTCARRPAWYAADDLEAPKDL